MTLDLARMNRERLERLRGRMRTAEIDVAVLLHGPHVTYATGHVNHAVDATHATFGRAVAIVPAEGRVQLYAHRSDDADAEVLPPLCPELDDDVAKLAAAVSDLDGSRIAVDDYSAAMLRSSLPPPTEVFDAGRLVGSAKLVKTADEIECIDLAQRVTEEAMMAAFDALEPGATRLDLAGAFLRRLNELDNRACVIDPIFQPMGVDRADGPRTSTGHVAFPTGIENPVFDEGDLVWVDVGVEVHGYASDFGRTWIAGRGPTADEQALFDRWMVVVQASYDTIAPGATLGDVGRAAHAADGGGDVPWLPHFYLAHGLGIESAEMPMIGTDLGQEFDDGFVLEEGMIAVLEPVIWADGVGGYRSEEITVVTADGCRVLGGAPGYAPFTS